MKERNQKDMTKKKKKKNLQKYTFFFSLFQIMEIVLITEINDGL